MAEKERGDVLTVDEQVQVLTPHERRVCDPDKPPLSVEEPAAAVARTDRRGYLQRSDNEGYDPSPGTY